jgi:hypothetical protein
MWDDSMILSEEGKKEGGWPRRKVVETVERNRPDEEREEYRREDCREAIAQ